MAPHPYPHPASAPRYHLGSAEARGSHYRAEENLSSGGGGIAGWPEEA
jgi:hypothetical protein